MKITMLGISGAGKTSFMSGLYEAFVANQTKLFSLSSRRDGAAEPVGVLAENAALADLSFQTNKDFPPSTSKTTQWSFKLHRTNPICDIDWLDFRGGVLTSTIEEVGTVDVRAELDIIHGHIVTSHTLLLFVSSLHLEHLPVVRARKEAGVDVLVEILRSYQRKYSGRKLTFLICATKVDALTNDYTRNNYAQLRTKVEDAFSGLTELCTMNPMWRGGILPLTVVGNGPARTTTYPPRNFRDLLKSEVELNDYPPPQECVAAALFYCVGQMLNQTSLRSDNEIKVAAAEIEQILSSSSIFSDILAALTDKPTSIARVEEIRAHQQAERDSLNSYQSHIEPMLTLAKRYVTLFPKPR